jgi:hypothetical protein
MGMYIFILKNGNCSNSDVFTLNVCVECCCMCLKGLFNKLSDFLFLLRERESVCIWDSEEKANFQRKYTFLGGGNAWD